MMTLNLNTEQLSLAKLLVEWLNCMTLEKLGKHFNIGQSSPIPSNVVLIKYFPEVEKLVKPEYSEWIEFYASNNNNSFPLEIFNFPGDEIMINETNSKKTIRLAFKFGQLRRLYMVLGEINSNCLKPLIFEESEYRPCIKADLKVINRIIEKRLN